MAGKASPLPGIRLRLYSWPTLAVVLLIIQAILSLTAPRSFALTAYSSISYLLVLLLATGVATLNAIENRQSIRLFWSFLTAGFGLWALNQGIWTYYVVALGKIQAGLLLGTSALFLHIVPMIAAVASRPHLKLLGQRPYRTTLNFLLLLFFLIFLYAFLLFPYRIGDPAIRMRTVALYFAENLLLLAVLSLVISRAQPPWRSIYWHLLGASTLTALGTLPANIGIAVRGGYVAGWLDLPYTAAACWFVWVALEGRRRTPQLAQTVQVDTIDPRFVSLPAMLAVVSIPLIGMWELFRADEPYGARVARLLIVLIFLVFLATAASIQHYLVNRELTSDVGLAQYLLRLAMQSGNAVVWDLDVKTGRDTWFGDLPNMFGIPSDTYSGKVEDFYRYVHPEDRRMVSEAVMDARLSRQPYAAEFRIVRQDGAVRWVSATGKFYYASNGDPVRMLGMAVDVTERRQTEQMLRESEQRFRLVANTAPVMIWMSGPDKLCTYFNQPWLAFTGKTLEAELGNGWADGVHAEDLKPCLDTYTAAFDRRESFKMQYRLRRNDGEYRWIFDIGVPRFNADGSFAGYIGSCTDITDRKLAEEALAEASGRLIEAQEEERRRIARELHDDINQRLALLAIQLEQMKDELPATDVSGRHRADELLQMAGEISSEVQAISHELHSSKLDLLGLAAAMKGFCKEFSEQQKVEVQFTHTDVPPGLSKEVSIALFRVLQEGLRNALKHSGVRNFEAQLRGLPGQILLTIHDSGVGFSPDLVSRKSGGLGLVSMQERIHLVHGRLWVKSRPNGGTEITVSVPWDSAATAARARAAAL